MSIESPTARRAARVEGQARCVPDPLQLGEVDPEHEAEDQADDRDHEEARRRPSRPPTHAACGGEPRRPAGAGRARRTSRPRRRRAAGRHGEAPPSRSAVEATTAQTSTATEDQHVPGSTGTTMPDQADERRPGPPGGRSSSCGQPVTAPACSPQRADTPPGDDASPGQRPGLAYVVGGCGSASRVRAAAGVAASLSVSSWTVTAISRSLSPCSRAWWAQNSRSPPPASSTRR